GRRVEHTAEYAYGQPATDLVYDLAGHVAAEHVIASGGFIHQEIYAGSLHVASYSDYMYFDFDSALGTGRYRQSINGPAPESCESLPFGDALSCQDPDTDGWTDDSPMHFAGSEHDSESNLEHFWFRQYSNTQGRWLSPDPAGLAAANPADPQSWNRYAYVENQPLTMIDPLGLCPTGWFCQSITVYGWVGDPGPGAAGGMEWGHPKPYSDAKDDRPQPGGGCILCGPWYVAPTPPPTFKQALDCIGQIGQDLSLGGLLNDATGGAVGNGPLATALLDNPLADGASFFGNLASGKYSSAASTAGSTAAGYAATKFGPEAAAKVGSLIPNLSFRLNFGSVSASSVSEFSFDASLSLGTAATAGASALGAALNDFGQVLKLPWDLSALGFAAIGCAVAQ
ncbi:MAG: RHS repeat-associated core domain-containing protein, partial [Terriglobales bacterium]